MRTIVLKGAQGGISPDWRFGIACNAARKLCTILLYAEPYRPERTPQHYRTIQSLPIILGEDRKDDPAHLDACRSKRNRAEYDYVGGASEEEAEELPAFAWSLREGVLAWLGAEHPDSLPA